MSFSLDLLDPLHWMLNESLSVWPAMLYVNSTVLEVYSNTPSHVLYRCSYFLLEGICDVVLIHILLLLIYGTVMDDAL